MRDVILNLILLACMVPGLLAALAIFTDYSDEDGR